MQALEMLYLLFQVNIKRHIFSLSTSVAEE